MGIKILAIESSCDETAAAVVEDGRTMLSNIINSQADLHEKYGGVVPEIASRKHIENISGVVDLALECANCKLSDMDAVAVTAGPGLVGALLVGVSYAKSIAYAAKLPLVAVHHIEGHIAANYIAHKDLKPPFICLVASGGHTHIVKVLDYNSFNILAKTRDDASGEAFDKAARVIGLGYPGGPKMDRLAQKGTPGKIKFPMVTFAENLDFSYSGVKTALINFIHKLTVAGIDIKEMDSAVPVLSNIQISAEKLSGGGVKVLKDDFTKADIAAAFQSAVIDVLISRCLLICRQENTNKLSLSGGVASNSYLRQQMDLFCNREGIHCYYPDKVLCTDNAAMIGSAGYFEFEKGFFADLTLNATPYIKLGGKFGIK